MRVSLWTCLLFPLFLLSSPVIRAQGSPASSPTVAPANHSPDDRYSKEPYVYDLVQTALRFEPDGRGSRDLIVRARIQSESAVHEFGLLVYSFASKFETLDVLYARVRKPDGTVVETPQSDVQELDSAVSREAPMYTDEREKHIAIKSLSVGDILEAHLHWTIREPIAPGHFWFDYSYFHAGICLKEVLEINVPSSLPVKLRNSEPKPSIREEGDRLLYTFQSSHLKKPEESKIPDWEKNYHGVPPPDIQISSFSSWDEVGRWFGSLVQPKAMVTPEIRAKAEELAKGKTTDDEKLHALYDFVSARYRYIGVDLGLSRYTPHSAADVLANRYGDCKDKHTLFAALLQAAGISAFPVLISSRFRIDPSFPSPSLFDHVITAIPRGDSFLVLDTTPEVAPFGLLLAGLRDRQALVNPAPAPARLITTLADPPFASFEHFSIDSSLDAHGTLDGKMHLELRGDSEVVFRLAYRSTPQNRWQELTQNIVAGMGFGGTVSEVSVSQPNDTDKPFSLSCSYHRTDFSDWKNHRITFPSPPALLSSLSEEQKLSKDPLPMGSRSEIIHEATIKLPPNFSAVVPSNVSRKTDFAEYSADFSFQDSVLHGTVHLKTLLREVPGEKRHDFSNLAKTISDTENRYILISGNFPDSDFSPANLMRLDPNKPEEAIPTLEKAVAANPDNRMGLVMLSQAYTRAGRPKDAVAILEKALSETSDDTGDTYFALGQAYLAVPDADKALANYQKALGEDPKPAALNTVAYFLAEANVHLRDALDYSTRAVSSLSEETMDISPDSAEPSDFALMVQLAANWDTLGWIKFRLGDSPAAEKYLEASWRLIQRAETGEHLVEVYEGSGQKRKAAQVCLLANAALGHDASPDQTVRQKLTGQMNRLRPFLQSASASGSNSTNRPSTDAYVALTDMRSVNIPLRTKLRGESGRATFVISLINGPKVDAVIFLSGSEELRAVIPAMSSAKYSLSFPDDVPTRILLKANLNCSIYSKDCLLFISTVTEAATASLPVRVTTTPPIKAGRKRGLF